MLKRNFCFVASSNGSAEYLITLIIFKITRNSAIPKATNSATMLPETREQMNGNSYQPKSPLLAPVKEDKIIAIILP